MPGGLLPRYGGTARGDAVAGPAADRPGGPGGPAERHRFAHPRPIARAPPAAQRPGRAARRKARTPVVHAAGVCLVQEDICS